MRLRALLLWGQEEGIDLVLMRVVLGAIGAVAIAGSVAAQDAPKDGFYVRAGAGAAFMSDLDQVLSYNPTPNPQAGLTIASPISESISFDTGFVGTAAVGFDYADGIRTELEYRYSTNKVSLVSRGFNPVVVPQAPFMPDQSLNAHFIFSNFYYDFRSFGRFSPFIGLGVGGAFAGLSLSDQGQAASSLGERDAALAYQAKAGVSYAFDRYFFVDVEYAFVRTNTLRFGTKQDEFVPGGPVGPSIDGDNFVSSSVMVSLRKQF